MKKEARQKFWQAVICLLCAMVAWKYAAPFEGTEFSGGRITAPVLTLYDAGTYLFLLALLLTFVLRRIAAAIALGAALLCLPLYLYFTAPGPFRSVFRGEYSVPAPASFVWDKGAIVGLLSLLFLVYICLRSLSAADPDAAVERGPQ